MENVDTFCRFILAHHWIFFVNNNFGYHQVGALTITKNKTEIRDLKTWLLQEIINHFSW